MINHVVLKDLTIHKDERGRLFEILRSDSDIFGWFGQAYITVCNPGWVKGWHYHKLQSDYFCVVYGKAKIVLCDIRKESSTFGISEEYVLDWEKPQLLIIPMMVVHGFECLSDTPCHILNLPTRLYDYNDPDEHRIKLDSTEVSYEGWKDREGW